LLYERAAATGHGKAATAAGWTYDPVFLARIKAGIRGDIEAAVAWYRRGVALGDAAAREGLAQHGLQEAE
jgi:TPR repeat protein